MTTKRERLEAAFAGELIDRPPVSLWRHFPVDDQDPEQLAHSTAAFQQRYDFDFVKVTPASSFCLKDLGVEDVWRGSTEGTRDYEHRVIKKPSDWRSLPVLKPRKGNLVAQLRCLELLRKQLDPGVPFIQTVFSPLAQAKNLAGQDRLLEHLWRSPEDVLAGLETITRSTISFVEAARGTSVAGIFYAIQHATYRLFDRQTYARFGEPFDQRILEAASGMWLNVLHLHGVALMFELAAELPVQVVNWHDRVAGPSLPEGKALVGGAVCGGLRRWDTLVLGDPAAVRTEAEQAISSVERRGMILGSGCVVPVIAPRSNLQAARESVGFA
ncbi:MAG: uroporphyrinogen decarboxylase family protein [Anaerolineales bacterium]|jgi:uroporphyrinogen decarboxylase